ncbi:cytochrome c oxidase-like protein-assembly factor cox16 [Delitschia confertaspora ATCC 74209]|uniref:Cytochrome c oxidase assembly protein COX16, mitochondrial n=1 Tax=Delitschia confertaspora ATCC 74209 TaxID=1513339 RepID=A0A9P4MU36_9PLEO|nr:cytochrome c oxidase-like protein-assembly factor cox16 [Delitschia confertaspora ATCC 74209]
MPTLPSKSFRATLPNTLASRYRRALNKHPFLLFGLPFVTTIVAGSFFLTPATALRYERYDRKNQQMTKEQALGIGKDRRKVDMREEFYRLQAKDLENWEQKRVKRLPGEIDGILE